MRKKRVGWRDGVFSAFIASRQPGKHFKISLARNVWNKSNQERLIWIILIGPEEETNCEILITREMFREGADVLINLSRKRQNNFSSCRWKIQLCIRKMNSRTQWMPYDSFCGRFNWNPSHNEKFNYRHVIFRSWLYFHAFYICICNVLLISSGVCGLPLQRSIADKLHM